ncbi:histone-lysine N-methyltransferase, H3 lysine-79 specific-like [Puntigrus tetrazona]|uniref:histone-lysine N-methyltransferase, H3 lysine-79 specific-like n=1 Tax=Puntigrus tetrazona TaxID=1606681 RepID=UPI001C89391A|nr:histone-lysine N-methyltransferase, H3 lysine-79 specific-like [Puntigrus tetrazona]
MAGAHIDELGRPADPRVKLRFMVLGGDDALMDKACAAILGERDDGDAFRFGNLKPRKAQVCGRQVSVLKTPSYWLEHLKSYYIFINGVKLLLPELQFFESLLFPGSNAFLLVLKNVKNACRENYLLHALSEVFGKEVLDYCMVLFMNEVRLSDPNNNSCVKLCKGRYQVLKNTDESVYRLFEKTREMTGQKKSIFFSNHLECFRKAEKHFEAENEIKQAKLRRELLEHKESVENVKTETRQLKEAIRKEAKEINERIEEELKKLATGRENELDALKRKENQMKDFQELKEELRVYENREKELRNETDALKKSEKEMKEENQKLKEELSIYKNREKELKNETDALKRVKNT